MGSRTPPQFVKLSRTLNSVVSKVLSIAGCGASTPLSSTSTKTRETLNSDVRRCPETTTLRRHPTPLFGGGRLPNASLNRKFFPFGSANSPKNLSFIETPRQIGEPQLRPLLRCPRNETETFRLSELASKDGGDVK